MSRIYKKISIFIMLAGIMHITCVQSAEFEHSGTASFQMAKKLSWLLLMPSVIVYELSNTNGKDTNKMDIIVMDSQGRNATITIPKVAAESVRLHQGDDLTLSHYNTGSMLLKDQKPLVYLLNAPR